MHTVRCSGRLEGAVCQEGCVCLPKGVFASGSRELYTPPDLEADTPPGPIGRHPPWTEWLLRTVITIVMFLYRSKALFFIFLLRESSPHDVLDRAATMLIPVLCVTVLFPCYVRNACDHILGLVRTEPWHHCIQCTWQCIIFAVLPWLHLTVISSFSDTECKMIHCAITCYWTVPSSMTFLKNISGGVEF